MKKKYWIISGIVIALLVVIGGVYVYVSQQNTQVSDEEVKEKFDCSRVTTDARATDIYCKNPELYREHLKMDIVIGPNEFYKTAPPQ